MVFVSVKGFLKKTYNVIIEAPYDEIDEVKVTSRFRAEINHKGKKYVVMTSDISAKILVNGIKEVIESSRKPVVVSGL